MRTKLLRPGTAKARDYGGLMGAAVTRLFETWGPRLGIGSDRKAAFTVVTIRRYRWTRLPVLGEQEPRVHTVRKPESSKPYVHFARVGFDGPCRQFVRTRLSCTE